MSHVLLCLFLLFVLSLSLPPAIVLLSLSITSSSVSCFCLLFLFLPLSPLPPYITSLNASKCNTKIPIRQNLKHDRQRPQQPFLPTRQESISSLSPFPPLSSPPYATARDTRRRTAKFTYVKN